MIDQACLASLDGLLWLRTGHNVASKFNQHQTTVSRNSRKCAHVFDISLERINAEWHVIGNQNLLNLERRVHQHVRFSGDDNNLLRLDAQHWSGPLLCTPPPAGWIAGNLNFLEYHRPLQLLKERIIDAWVASYPDVPEDNPELTAIRLSKMPMYLVVKAGHPLLELGNALTFAAVARYPLLPLPDSAFPKFQQVLIDCGLSTHASTSACQTKTIASSQVTIEDLVVGFASPLSLPLYGDSFRILPLRLPIEVGDAVVVRREFAQFDQIQRLSDFLRNRLSALASTRAELCVLDGNLAETTTNEIAELV